jgi:hypothetical protein
MDMTRRPLVQRRVSIIPMPHIPKDHHRAARVRAAGHREGREARRGIRIVNCSPISAVTCFERQPLEAFL